MTDEHREQPPGTATGETAEPPGATSPHRPTFEQRVDAFGREAGEAGERIGRQAEAAGRRFASDPTVMRAADTAARAWGLVLVLVGAWFLADVTLALELPHVPWADLWPIGLIAIGLMVVARGMSRQRA